MPKSAALRALALLLCGFPIIISACASGPKLAIYPPYHSETGAETGEEAWQALDVDALLAAHPVEPGWSFQVIDLEKLENSSTHLVRVRTREKTHYHDRHDLTAIMLAGHGMLYIGRDKVELVPGATVTIPRRILHEFVNESEESSVFYVIFSPPFEGKDRVRVRKMEELLD